MTTLERINQSMARRLHAQLVAHGCKPMAAGLAAVAFAEANPPRHAFVRALYDVAHALPGGPAAIRNVATARAGLEHDDAAMDGAMALFARECDRLLGAMR